MHIQPFPHASTSYSQCNMSWMHRLVSAACPAAAETPAGPFAGAARRAAWPRHYTSAGGAGSQCPSAGRAQPFLGTWHRDNAPSMNVQPSAAKRS